MKIKLRVLIVLDHFWFSSLESRCVSPLLPARTEGMLSLAGLHSHGFGLQLLIPVYC